MTDATTSRNLIFQQRRRRVHLWLIIAFRVSLVTVLRRLSLGMHELIGLAFAALALVHLRQRSKRVRGLLIQLRKVRTLTRPIVRLAWSDLILLFTLFSLIVSGIADYLVGGPGIFLTIDLPPGHPVARFVGRTGTRLPLVSRAASGQSIANVRGALSRTHWGPRSLETLPTANRRVGA